jgi:hypothetical protein
MWVSEKSSLHGIHFRNPRTPGHTAYRPDVPSDYHPFIVVKRNPGGHTFKDGRELETVLLTFSLVTRDKDQYRCGIEKLIPRCKWHNFGRTLWKIGGLAVQLNMNSRY